MTSRRIARSLLPLLLAGGGLLACGLPRARDDVPDPPAAGPPTSERNKIVFRASPSRTVVGYILYYKMYSHEDSRIIRDREIFALQEKLSPGRMPVSGFRRVRKARTISAASGFPLFKNPAPAPSASQTVFALIFDNEKTRVSSQPQTGSVVDVTIARDIPTGNMDGGHYYKTFFGESIFDQEGKKDADLPSSWDTSTWLDISFVVVARAMANDLTESSSIPHFVGTIKNIKVPSF